MPIKKYLLIILFLGQLFSCNGQQNIECVFSDSSITENFLKDTTKVVSYSWDDKTKEGQAILVNGGIVSMKKWACTHYGLSSNMLLKKDTQILEEWKKYLLEMSSIIDVDSNFKELEQRLESIELLEDIRKSDSKYEIDLSNNIYPEYYVTIYELSDCFVFSIFHYRN